MIEPDGARQLIPADYFFLGKTLLPRPTLLPQLAVPPHFPAPLWRYGINAKDGRRLFEHRLCRAGPR